MTLDLAQISEGISAYGYRSLKINQTHLGDVTAVNVQLGVDSC